MTVNNLLDLYTDYLLVTPTYCTATGLSAVTDNMVSHDRHPNALGQVGFFHVMGAGQTNGA